MTDSTDSERANRTWSVTVAVNGSEVLTIESNCLSGAPNIDDYADEIRTCANNLLSFIGEPHGNAGEDAEGDSFFNMLWDWFEDESRIGAEGMRPERREGLSADDFKIMLDEHEASLMDAARPLPKRGAETMGERKYKRPSYLECLTCGKTWCLEHPRPSPKGET